MNQGKHRWVFYGVALYLIAMALYRGIVPGGPVYPPQTVALMSMGFTLLMTVAVIPMGRRMLADPTLAVSRHGTIRLLMWAGTLAGLALLAYRLGSHGGWYTGHLFEYRLP
jgi:hypothetical protein